MTRVLFLCTGNYYRSRFAEHYFRLRALEVDPNWEVDSRGLELHDTNIGPISVYALHECDRLGISVDLSRFPRALERSDLESATLVIAVKEAEHRHRVRQQFPDWEERIEYWNVHDLDVAQPDQTLAHLRELVDSLVTRLRQAE